jgi:hypothetical protein
MPTPEGEKLEVNKEGKLEVNKQYQEAIKIVINLVTASLILPTVFLTNILGLKAAEIKGQLYPMAYVAWALLGISLLACVGFYVFSTKFTKAVYGLYTEREKARKEAPGTIENRRETWRDVMGMTASASGVAGLLSLLIFFGVALLH